MTTLNYNFGHYFRVDKHLDTRADKTVDNRPIYIGAVRRAYLREQKASLALPFVPVGTGTPDFPSHPRNTPYSENSKKEKKEKCQEVRYEI